MATANGESLQIGGDVSHSVIATGNNVQINYNYYQAAQLAAPSGVMRLTGPGALRHGDTVISVCCDRDEQWQEFETCVRNQMHQVIFICGPRFHGHDFFLDRVKLHLVAKHPVRVIEPQWKTGLQFPRTLPEYLEAISDELKCSVERLPGRLEQELNSHDLLAMHPRIGEDFEHDALQNYYTKWLQDLLKNLKTKFRLKCVQPIEWVPVPLGMGTVLSLVARAAELIRRLGPGLLRDALNERRARGMMRAIQQKLTIKNGSQLLARSLPELSSIRERHVVKFCKDYLYMEKEDAMQRIVETRVMVGANNPDEVIRSVAAYLCVPAVSPPRHPG